MRKTLVALTLLIALAVIAGAVPGAFAAAPTAPALTAPFAALDLSPTPLPLQPTSDFALWLTQGGPVASPSSGCTAQICTECRALGKACCILNFHCVCAPSNCGA